MTPTIMTGETYAAIADAADRLEKTLGAPLYRVAADWLNSTNPGETTERIEKQISIAGPAGATLMIEGADALFASRKSGETGPDETMVSVQNLVQKFTEGGVPLIFTIKDENLAERISNQTGWTLKIAG